MAKRDSNDRPRRVLLLRADATSPNLGVRVLAAGMTAVAQEAWGAGTVVHVQNYDGGDTGRSFNKKAVLKDILAPRGPIRSTLRQYDVVVDVGGGDSFTDIYGLRRLALLLYTQWASHSVRVPTVLAPQTIGPFSGRLARRFASASLRRMALVLSRDNASEREAASLGRPVDLSATDVVFALPVPSVPKSRGVVINPSGLLWQPNSHVDHVRYRASVRELIRELLAAGHQVSLMPHVLDSPNKDNDHPVVRELGKEFGDRVAQEVPKSLDEVREIVASAQLVVGARMHACLNSISVGTPAIPWAYSRKFAPLLSDIGWDHVVDIREEQDPVRATIALLDDPGLLGLSQEVSSVRSRAEARLAEVVQALRGLELGRGR